MISRERSFDITITQAMIDEYARLSGDFNPIHVDQEIAAGTPFGGTIAHGCIPMEPIFKALHRLVSAPTLPSGSRMSLRYWRPSQPGDIISLSLQPQDRSSTQDRRKLEFACVNQRGEIVLQGDVELP